LNGITQSRFVELPNTAAVLVSVIVFGLISCGTAHAAGRPVSFRGASGRTVNGVLTEASQRPSAAVVLVPMLGRSKDDWQAVAEGLASANVTSLAIDLPGSAIPEDATALAGWQTDVRSAVDFLSGSPGVRSGAVGIAGASLGANLAVLVAAADARVRSIALVSPTLDYRGVRIETPLRQYGGRPALLVASLKDAYSARSVRELAKEAPGVRETRWAETPAHGTVLLSREPDLVQALVEWFQRTL
jgi:alpha-beta hydrolase superfamily lysophospholipase